MVAKAHDHGSQAEEARGDRPAFVTSLHIRGGWTLDRISAALIVAAVLPLAAAWHDHGAPLMTRLAVALLVTLGWQLVFTRSRRLRLGWDGISTAITFVVMLPGAVPLGQIALALTFGVVAGEQIFGGRGRTFLSPAAVGLAFLFFSFPNSAPGVASGLIGLATIPGAALLILLGLVSWRVVAAAFGGLSVFGLLSPVDYFSLVTSGSFAFGLVFLGCDSVSAACTNPGRLVYGWLIGVFAVVLGGADASAVVFAVLLGSIFAPVIDWTVAWRHERRRRGVHG